MRLIKIREQKRYTLSEFQNLFRISNREALYLLKRFKAVGVLKLVRRQSAQFRMNELSEHDVLIAEVSEEDTNFYYVFDYVGLLSVGEFTVLCYPKFYLREEPSKEDLSLLFRALERYKAEGQHIELYSSEQTTTTDNLIAVMLFLIRDYFDSGLYANRKDITELNGAGEIQWEKTINSSVAFLVDNKPFYFDMHTAKTVSDDESFFTRLHAAILTEVSRQMADSGLHDLFGLTQVNLTDQKVASFGSSAVLVQRIEAEIGVQFNSRKQSVLNAMHAFISKSINIANDDMMLFGTTSLNLVWEKICSQVLGNHLGLPLSELGLSQPIAMKFDPRQTLSSVIERPVWRWQGEHSEVEKPASDTLRPDSVFIDHVDGIDELHIMDAKYYVPEITKERFAGLPGIQDISKQYLYELSLRDFIDSHEISVVSNSFLMPFDGAVIMKAASVTLKMMNERGLSPIQVFYLPATLMFESYLDGSHVSISGIIK